MAITAAALARRVLNSASSDRLLKTVDPRYVKESTQSRVVLPIQMEGGFSTSWAMTWVFLMLMVRVNSLHAKESLSTNCWSPVSVWDASAASSANSISLRRTLKQISDRQG